MSAKKVKSGQADSNGSQSVAAAESPNSKKVSKNRKLSFKETKELENLPAQIEKLEDEIAQVHQAMADPDFYKRDGQEIAQEQERRAQSEVQMWPARTAGREELESAV